MNNKLTLKQSLLAGLFAGLAAAVINAVLFLIFRGTGVITDSIYVKPKEPLTIVPVIMASIVPLVIGSFLFYLVERFTASGLKIFTVVALVLTAISLISPFTVIPGVTTGYALVLCLMHIVAALSLLYFLRRAKGTTTNFQTT